MVRGKPTSFCGSLSDRETSSCRWMDKILELGGFPLWTLFPSLTVTPSPSLSVSIIYLFLSLGMLAALAPIFILSFTSIISRFPFRSLWLWLLFVIYCSCVFAFFGFFCTFCYVCLCFLQSWSCTVRIDEVLWDCSLK